MGTWEYDDQPYEGEEQLHELANRLLLSTSPVELWHSLVMFHFGWTDQRVMDRPADLLTAHQRTFSLEVWVVSAPTAEEVQALRAAATADFCRTVEVFISSTDGDAGRIVNAAQCLPFIVELLEDAHAHLHERAGGEPSPSS